MRSRVRVTRAMCSRGGGEELTEFGCKKGREPVK
jgi:hypothetical protein